MVASFAEATAAREALNRKWTLDAAICCCSDKVRAQGPIEPPFL
jgi:hypothetical protein